MHLLSFCIMFLHNVRPIIFYSTGRETMTTDYIEQLEANIRESRKILKRGEALERLYSNRDFKEVILSGYMEKEAIRLVHLRSDPAMQSPMMQESIIKQIDSVANLGDYFRTVAHKAMVAEKGIASDEETREEILAQELEA